MPYPIPTRASTRSSALTCAALMLALATMASFAQAQQVKPSTVPVAPPTSATPQELGFVKIEANPQKGFDSPYLLFLPPGLQSHTKNMHAYLLVVPTNTGKPSDDPEVALSGALHEARWRELATSLNAGLLLPMFPRPRSHDRIYTHALGRSAMLTTLPGITRIDLQLIHMIDDVRHKQKKHGIVIDRRVLMLGFSAQAMFINRFVFMHPERVQAAAFGSPGGWAIAPVATWKGRDLRYPVGVADFKQITGRKFDLLAVSKVPQFLFMGDADKNDSVVYGDSYEKQDRDLVFELFGPTLMARWPFTEELYRKYLPATELKLYPGVEHTYTSDMVADFTAFFKKHDRIGQAKRTIN